MSSKITAVPITLVGLGSIGISFAALYLKYSQASVSVYDPRPDLEEHIRSVLPVYLDTSDEAFSIDTLIANKRLHICSSLEDACKDAVVVQGFVITSESTCPIHVRSTLPLLNIYPLLCA